MSNDTTHNVTHLLQAWSSGDSEAAARLLPLIYDPLRRLAHEYMRQERRGHTLEPTALVHEVYLRLTDSVAVGWQDRVHFFSLAARAMRRILVDHARARERERRGGGHERISLENADAFSEPDPGGNVNLVDLDEALERLAKLHPRPSKVVELRFFGGLDAREIAAALQVSERTVKREWQFARIWLHRELGRTGDKDGN